MAEETRDAIEVLEHDHREVEEMFDKLEPLMGGAQLGEDQLEQKRTLVDQAIIELVRHSVAEEQYLYPKARDVLPDGTEITEREISEHSAAEKTMNELDGMSPDNVEFDSKVRTLMTQIKQHVSEEEGELFPKLRQAVTEEQLHELGKQISSTKKVAPTRPHPLAPDHPPFNKLAGPGAALVDRLRDAITGRGKD